MLVLVAGGVLSVLALLSDDLGITPDNRTIDPYQVAGFIIGVVVGVIGVGVAFLVIDSPRSSPPQRIAGVAAATVTAAGWALVPGFVVAVQDCVSRRGCGIAWGFRPERNMYHVFPSWKVALIAAAVATVFAAWGFLGLWRPSRLSRRQSSAVYWAATAVTWLILGTTLALGFSEDA